MRRASSDPTPMKRVTTVEGRSPGSGCFARSGRREIGDEPNSPEDKTRRTPREAVREGQDGAGVPASDACRHVRPVRELDAGNLHVQFDEGVEETERK